MKLTASDRKSLIRLASSLPKGSEERRVILKGLSKSPTKTASTPAQIADLLLETMADDNGVDLDVDPAQRRKLERSVAALAQAGLNFDRSTIQDLAAGEMGEVEDTFGHLPGFSDFSDIMDGIFNEF